MKPTALLRELSLMYRTRSACMLRSAPGLGKSALVRQFADANGLELLDFRLLYADLCDLRGLPDLDRETQTTRWLRPAVLPTGGRGILFLDELTAAPRAVQCAAYQLTHERRLAEWQVPPDWVVWGAGNRAGDRAVANPMPSALCSRMVFLDLEADLNDWTAWAFGPGNMPGEVVAFLQFKPTALHDFDPTKWLPDTGFGCPRSWEKLGQLYTAAMDAKESLSLDLCIGTVGPGAGTEFYAFIQCAATLPNWTQVVSDPDGTPVPTKPDVQYAAACMLSQKADKHTFGRALAYAERFSKRIEVFFVQLITRMKGPELASCKEYILWAQKPDNQALFGASGGAK